MLFLIDYERKGGRLVAIRRFSDSEQTEAHKARLALELKQHRNGIEREIVILQAKSEAALRKTHRRYFETLESIANSL